MRSNKAPKLGGEFTGGSANSLTILWMTYINYMFVLYTCLLSKKIALSSKLLEFFINICEAYNAACFSRIAAVGSFVYKLYTTDFIGVKFLWGHNKAALFAPTLTIFVAGIFFPISAYLSNYYFIKYLKNKDKNSI